MEQNLDQMHRDFKECIEKADFLLRKMQEQVANETVPSAEDWSRAGELVTELRSRYDNICRSAREWIPEDEMPAEGMPADDFIKAAQSNRAMMEQELRQILRTFLAIRSSVKRFAAALAPYQEEAQLLLNEPEGRSVGDPEFMMQQIKAPKALLEAISIKDLYSDEGCALLDQLEEYYSSRICQGVIGRLYYVDSQSLTEVSSDEENSFCQPEEKMILQMDSVVSGNAGPASEQNLPEDARETNSAETSTEEIIFESSADGRETIGIDDPSILMHAEDSSILSIQSSARAGNKSCSTENAEDESAPEHQKGNDAAPAENPDTPIDEADIKVEILFEEEDPVADPDYTEYDEVWSAEESNEAEPAGEPHDAPEEGVSARTIFKEAEDIEADNVPAYGPGRESGISEAATGICAAADDRAFHDGAYLKMLADGRFYAAMAYVRTLAEENSYYVSVCRQLAYALNDPMFNCSYTSESVLNVYYYSSDTMLPGYYAAAASLRNYFLDQFSYDYNLKTLRDMLSVNDTVKANPLLDKILFTLEEFKETVHAGID